VEKEKKKKSWRISVLQQHNTALPKIQAFAPPPHNSSFWLLLLALGVGVCCVGFLAVCFGFWTFLHV
jgi:hypothetical protein